LSCRLLCVLEREKKRLRCLERNKTGHLSSYLPLLTPAHLQRPCGLSGEDVGRIGREGPRGRQKAHAGCFALLGGWVGGCTGHMLTRDGLIST
jgi:hypothetical protein